MSAAYEPSFIAGRPIMVVDIGGTGVKFGYSVDGAPHGYSRVFSSNSVRDGDPVEALAAMVATVTEEARLAPGAVVATVPGFIDVDFDHVLYAGNILALNGRHLASELAARVGCPVLLERDAVMALTGEMTAGAAQGVDQALGVFFGTGIGAAFIDRGAPFRGGGWALEIGHMPFRGDGRQLEGMRTDCLEAYCSGRALREIADRHGAPIGEVFIAAATRAALTDELALFVRDQAYAVATAVALFSPAVIVLGGGVLEIDSYPRDRLVALLEAHAPVAETGRAIDLRWARLGWGAALHGAPQVLAARLAQAAANRADQAGSKSAGTGARRPTAASIGNAHAASRTA